MCNILWRLHLHDICQTNQYFWYFFLTVFLSCKSLSIYSIVDSFNCPKRLYCCLSLPQTIVFIWTLSHSSLSKYVSTKIFQCFLHRDIKTGTFSKCGLKIQFYSSIDFKYITIMKYFFKWSFSFSTLILQRITSDEEIS